MTMNPSALPEHTLSRIPDQSYAKMDDPQQRYTVIMQEVELEANFREKRFGGRVHITINGLEKLDEVTLDARQSTIDLQNVTVEVFRNGSSTGPAKKVPATYDDKYSLLAVPRSWNATAEHHNLRRIRMQPVMRFRHRDLPVDKREFSGCTPIDGSLKIKLRPKEDAIPERPKLIIRKSTLTPDTPLPPLSEPMQYRITIPFWTNHVRDGVHFVGVDPGDMRFPHVYSRHSIEPGTASCIFPCVDDYGSRCDWKVSLKMPRTLGDALDQALVTQQANGITNGNQARSSERQYTLEERDKLLEMTAVCSGSLSDELDDPTDSTKKIMTFESQKTTSPQKIGFAVGPFEHIDLWSAFRTEEDDEKLGANALKIHGYCLPGRADLVRNTCVALAAAADFFTLSFATHPFDSFKICFVDDMIRDSEPLHSFALVSNRLLFPDDMAEREIEVTRTIVHSLACQWSGSNMVANTRHDLWLVVGISHYMTELFMKRLCGNNEYRFRMKTLSDKLVETDVNRPSLHDLGMQLHLGDFEMEFMAHKAHLVLFILDNRLAKASGSSGLTKVISRLLTKANIQDSILSTSAFKKLCEKSGKYKLEAFWAQWVTGSGCPRFKLTQRFNKKRLCVEMNLRQLQEEVAAKKREIDKADFLRLVRESLHGVSGGPVQHLFTGPLTIRIHEADGTPYEHIVEIREDATRITKFEIPYNTKYKRLKRTRRQKERANAGVYVDVNGEHGEDALLYCLGDVLQGSDEMAAWELHDWDADVEKKMDQESYEWIRMDADFEWLCSMTTNLESYMYVSQLQQDRDVVAQQDSVLYLASSPRHPLVSTILTRTLVDRRYFHGIRTMAAEILPKHANIDSIPLLGFRHLLKAFTELFCYPGKQTPKPNDFSDKKQYIAQCAIIRSIARVRDEKGVCPEEGRRFILDQLLYNNNEDNMYSDHYYVAVLLEALTTSLIPDKKEEPAFVMSMDFEFDDGEEDNPYHNMGSSTKKEDPVLTAALEIIDRYRRRDEWELSYQNIWTVAALDAKQRLMKAGVIPTCGPDFLQYLQDGTSDFVRIKAFEALVDLGLFMIPAVFRFMMCVVSSDRSPFVRDRVLRAFFSGFAAVAMGEHAAQEVMPHSSDLVVMDSAQTLEDKKASVLRKVSLQDALAALKKEMQTQYADQELEFQRAIQLALESRILGRNEVQLLLEMCSILFDEADRFVVTLSLPKKWKVIRAPEGTQNKKCIVTFKASYATEPPPPLPTPGPTPEVAAAAPMVVRTPLPTSMAPPIRTPEPVQMPKPLQKRSSIVIKNGAKIVTARPSISFAQTPPLVPNNTALPTTQQPAMAQSALAVDPDVSPTSDKKPSSEKRPSEKKAGDKKLGEKKEKKIILGDSASTPPLPITAQASPPAKTPKRPRPEQNGAGGDVLSPANKKQRVDSRTPLPGGGPDTDAPTPPKKAKVEGGRTALPTCSGSGRINGYAKEESSDADRKEKAVTITKTKYRLVAAIRHGDLREYPNLRHSSRSSLPAWSTPKPSYSGPGPKPARKPLPDAVPSSARSSPSGVVKNGPQSSSAAVAAAAAAAAATATTTTTSSAPTSAPTSAPKPRTILKITRKPTGS